MDDFIKKSGDIVIGKLQLLTVPEEPTDAVNKDYVDYMFSSISNELSKKLSKNSDLDMNNYRIKNVKIPTENNDVTNKKYVDQIFDTIYPTQNIFSKGQIVPSMKKTYFFNPGFICPREMKVVSVGFSTSPYRYNIGQKVKLGIANPSKLYFMVNNEIKSEYVIEKDVQVGYVLKEFESHPFFEKGDNLMMIVESILEDASVNISFY